MNYATHLLNPIQAWGPRYIDARCGRRVHAQKEKIVTTTNPDEVTCTKCKNFIDNPVRILRKYGNVRVFGVTGIILFASNGFKIDLMMYKSNQISGFRTYTIHGETKSANSFEKTIAAGTIKEAMNKLIKFYETELIPFYNENS